MRVALCGFETLHQMTASPEFPLYGRLVPMRLAPIPYDAARDLITEPLRELGIRLGDADLITASIYRVTGGLPDLIQEVCRHIVLSHHRQGAELTLSAVEQVLQDRAPLERIWGVFRNLQDPLSRLILYVACDLKRIDAGVLLTKLRDDFFIQLDDADLQPPLDQLYLYSLLRERRGGSEYAFVSGMFRERIQEQLRGAKGRARIEALVGKVRTQYGELDTASPHPDLDQRRTSTALIVLRTPQELVEKYTGPYGLAIVLLALANLAPFTLGIYVDSVRLNVSIAALVYVAYHALRLHNAVAIRQLQTVLFSEQRAATRWHHCAVVHAFARPLSWLVLALLTLTLVGKINLVFMGVHTVPLPDLLYELLGVPTE